MLIKLSLRNVKKSIKDYVIYFFTLLTSIVIFYVFNIICEATNFLSLNSDKKAVFNLLSLSVKYVSFFVLLILGFLIVYANKFFIKRRSKEFALYTILGMNKKKIAFMLITESFLIGALTLFLGTVLGFFLSHFLIFLTSKIFNANVIIKTIPFFSNTFSKTVISFLTIFLLSTFLNIVLTSKIKIVNMINASKKKSKNPDKVFLFTGFFMVLYLFLYNLNAVFNHNLLNFSKQKIIVMLAFLVLQTFLFFYTFFYFSFLFLKKQKRFYYKSANMFLINEVNKSFFENVSTNTFTTLIFFLTMVMLSFSLSFCYIFNHNFSSNNKTDFSVISKNDASYEEKIKEVSNNYVTYNLYEDNLSFTDLLSKKTLKKVEKEYQGGAKTNDKVLLINASSYGKLMCLYGERKVALNDDLYAILSNVEKARKYYDASLSDNKKISFNGVILKPALKKTIQIPMFNFSVPSNNGVVVLPDKLLSSSIKILKVTTGNYKKGAGDEKLLSNFKNINVTIYTKRQMQNSSFGIGVIATYISLYLGITFLIASSLIISIKELSNATDMVGRYKILKLFTANNEADKILFKKVLITFLSPFVVSFIYALLVIDRINDFLKMYGTRNNLHNIMFVLLFVFLIYGLYFLLTYKMCRRILKK